MGYVFGIIWLAIVIKGIATAIRNGKKQNQTGGPSDQASLVTFSYHNQTIQLPEFVAKQTPFIRNHLVDVYRKMLDFYVDKFMHGGIGDYELTLQEHRLLAIGGIDDRKILELRDDAQETAMEWVSCGDLDSKEDENELNYDNQESCTITVSDDAYASAVASEDEDPHAGESYAAPIPPPHESPMAGAKMSSERHADSHVAPVNIKSGLPEHGPSMTAKHADSHIATTDAEKTPQTPSHAESHRNPFASIIPHGEKDLQKAMVLKEILGEPKGLQ